MDYFLGVEVAVVLQVQSVLLAVLAMLVVVEHLLTQALRELVAVAL
jgi:hypothetical protein